MRPDGDPEPRASKASTDENATPEPDEEPDFTAKQALRTPAFWMITLVHLSSSVSIVTLSLHLAPKLVDMGMSLSGAGVVVLTYTAIALPAQFIAGYLADRLPKPPLIFFFLVLQSTAMAIIAVAESVPIAYVFALLYGIGFGGRVPLLTAIRGDYFGRKAFATIMGLSQFPNNIAMIGAPLFAGFMYDTTGSYLIPFLSFAGLSFLGAFLMLFVRRPKSLQTTAVVAGEAG
jgi:MFS family permease